MQTKRSFRVWLPPGTRRVGVNRICEGKGSRSRVCDGANPNWDLMTDHTHCAQSASLVGRGPERGWNCSHHPCGLGTDIRRCSSEEFRPRVMCHFWPIRTLISIFSQKVQVTPILNSASRQCDDSGDRNRMEISLWIWYWMGTINRSIDFRGKGADGFDHYF